MLYPLPRGVGVMKNFRPAIFQLFSLPLPIIHDRYLYEEQGTVFAQSIMQHAPSVRSIAPLTEDGDHTRYGQVWVRIET